MKYQFSKSFLFGAATAAHQVEGGNHNDWADWEPINAGQAVQKANSPDYVQGKRRGLPPEAFEASSYISGQSVDHFNRYDEDLALAQQIGLTAYRFSVEWSRVEPEPGVYNNAAIQHYREMAVACRKYGLEPFVTLWHFSLPVWAANENGWMSEMAAERFVAFSETIVKELKDVVTMWATFNEPNLYALLAHAPAVIVNHADWWLSYPHGWKPYFSVRRRFAITHKAAYGAIKKIDPKAEIGICLNDTYYDGWVDPVSWLARRVRSYFTNSGYFIKTVSSSCDWLGIQYYYHNRVKIFPNTNLNERLSDLDVELFPEGHYRLLKNLSKSGKPIYVTESGLADRDDRYRAEYITQSPSAGLCMKAWIAVVTFTGA